MNRFARNLIALFAVCTCLALVCGCATTRAKTRSCAVILLVEAQHLNPSVRQYEAVQRALGPAFEQRGMQLVPDLTTSDLIATVELRPDPADPGRTELVVRDVAVNTFTRGARDQAMHPTLRESNREHEEAIRGFTRAGDI